MGFLDKLFNTEVKELNAIEKAVKPTEGYAETMAQMTDEQLRAKTDEFKLRLKNGETLDDILCEAFATVREAAKRAIVEYPYFVQLEGA